MSTAASAASRAPPTTSCLALFASTARASSTTRPPRRERRVRQRAARFRRPHRACLHAQAARARSHDDVRLLRPGSAPQRRAPPKAALQTSVTAAPSARRPSGRHRQGTSGATRSRRRSPRYAVFRVRDRPNQQINNSTNQQILKGLFTLEHLLCVLLRRRGERRSASNGRVAAAA